MATERWQALPPNSLLDIYYRLSQVNRLGQRTKSYQSERDWAWSNGVQWPLAPPISSGSVYFRLWQVHCRGWIL